MMFPAIVKDSYTLGGGFGMTKALDLELSAMFAPEVRKTVDISDAVGAPAGSFSNTTTHSQSAYSVSLRYKF
jgi:long-subunit fatty acid transport protein